MKNSLRSTLALRAFFYGIALFLMTTEVSWGQQLLKWNTFGNVGTETTEPSTFNDVNISSATLNYTGSSVTAAANSNRFGGANWNAATTISTTQYIQFTVTPNASFSFTPTSLVFIWDFSASGPKDVTLRSSNDNYTADLGTLSSMTTSTSVFKTINITGLTNITSATTFRLYGYNATATNGTGGFDCATTQNNVVLNGTTAAAGSTVTFNASSGSITTTTQTSATATNLTSASTLGLSRTGYTFSGWNTAANGSGTAYANNASYAFTTSTTLYAIWTANNNTITFNANTGSGTVMTNQTIATAASANLTSNTYTKAGYTFAGWNTLADGTGTAYLDGASYTMGTANVTLYAKWTANNNTITFDANTGTGTAMANQTIATAASANLTSNTYTKAGYTFAGWNTLADGTGTSYANSASYTMGTANVTLYAKWTANTLVITYNSQSGSAIANGSTTTGGSIASSPVTPTRAGYTFNGWFAASSGGTAITFPYTHGQTANFTLYAQWTINTYTITYNGNSSDGGAAPVDGSSPYNYNSTITVLGAGTLTYTGNTFAGWNTAADGSGTSYSAGANITSFAANTILYAQWTSNSAPACPFSTAVSPISTQTLCQGITATSLSAAITNAGNSGTPTYLYQWYYNTSNSNTVIGATPVSGETNSAFTPLTSASEVGTRYYFCVGYATDNSCTSSSTTQSLATSAVQVTVVATPSAPTGTASQAFCGSATVANLVASGTAVQWYADATGGGALASSTTIVDNTHYYASQTVNSCESTSRLDVTATINSIPNAPTGSASQSFCGSATIASLVATGTTVQWYAAATGGSALSSATALVSGTHYYASQTISGCASSSRLDVTATINTIPSAPSGSASQAFCVSGTVAGLIATGTAIQWYDAATGGNLVTSSTAIVSGTHYYASQTINGCESNSRFDVTATINSLPSAPTGSASQSFCGSATVASLVATGSTIQWYDAATGGNLLTSSTALVDANHYYASQTVNGCESSSRLDVTTTIVAVPATPTASNNGPVCLNEALTLSTPTVSGATYAWTGPNGYNDTTQNPTVSAAATAAMAGTYSVTVTVSGCTSAAGTTTVTVNSALVVGSVSGIATPVYGSNVVISQVYGGGGNTGAVYKNDFIELYNPTASSVDLTNWAVQYASATGTTWTVTSLSGSIAPGKYYLIQEAAGTGGTANLPTPVDATGTITMNGTAFKVALTNTTTALSGAMTTGTGTGVVDFVGCGTANGFETAVAPAPSNTTSIIRLSNGCTDSNNNGSDFVAGTVTPRNSASSANTCTTSVYTETICTGTTPSAASVTSASGSSGNYTYQWYSYNGLTTPSLISTPSSWTAVNTSQNLTTTPITQSTTYACFITPNGCGLGAWASGYRQVTVVVSPGVIASSQTICSGNTPAAFTSTTAASSSGTITYQWESSTSNTFASAVTTIASANSETFTPGSLTATTYYRRKATSTVNSVTCSAYSNIITISVNPMPSITLGLIDDVPLLATSFSIPYSATSGVDTFSVSAANTNVMPGFSAVVNASLVSTPIVVTIPTQNTAGVTYDFYMTVKNGTTGCVSSPYTFDIMVTGINHGAIGTDQTICSGNTPNTLTSVTAASGSGAVTYSWEQATVAINGPYTAILGETGSTYSPGALSQTTYYKRVAHIGSDAADTDPVTITVNPTLTASVAIAASPSGAICLGTSVTFAATPTNGGTSPSYQWKINGSTIGTDSATYTTTTLANNDAVTVVMTSNATPCLTSSPATSNTITIAIANNTWIGTDNSWSTGTNWSCGMAPTSLENATISAATANPSISANTAVKSLTIATGATVTLTSGTNLTVSDAVINNGTFTIENNANLIQTNEVANTGNAIVNRNSANIQLYDYTLWSSPVASQQLQAFSPSTLATRFYTYNPSTNLYNAVSSPSTTNFAVGTSYLIRAPNNWAAGATATPFAGQFTGVPNNGAVNLTGLASSSYYAVGNPYPSTILADSFLNGNSTDGTLYFWRKTNNAATTSYATYTLAGGTGTAANTGGSSSISPNGIIQVGQGFIVKTGASATTLTFNNTMRTANNDNQFLKTTEEKSRIWLNLSSATGFVCQTMVAYMSQATTGVDNGIDGLYFNDSQTAITSIIDQSEFAIQGKPVPFDTNDTVPLGFKTNAAGNFSIGIDHVDGLFSNGQTIFLKDNLANTTYNLSSGAYSFASDAGTYNSRFEIVYQSALVLPTFTANNVIVYSHNGEVTINSGTTPMNQVRIFDVRGRLLAEKNHINATETKLSVGAQNQVLLVKIGTTEGSEVTKKIIQ